MGEVPSTLQAQQLALARHVRDPCANPAPAGMEDRRLGIYRELFHNGIRSLLAGNFPVVRRTLGDDAWQALVRAFYGQYRARTPLFTEVGREFVAFLEQRADGDAGGDPPWLAELAHYEWVELALQISDADAPGPSGDGGTDPADLPLAVSPLAWALAYRWPVHRISPVYRPDAPPPAPTLLLLRRDAAGEVHFSELSAATWRLLELFDGSPGMTGHEALARLADEAGAGDPAGFVAGGVAMLRRLLDEGVLHPADGPQA